MTEFNWEDADVLASWAERPLFYEAPYPSGTEFTPRDYQQAAVEYCLARDHALIGDEPGLGKTPECILISNAIEAKRTLVICPASLRLNWEREIWRWSMVPNVRTYPILQSRDGASPEADYVITSYDMLRSSAILDALLEMRFDHMVLDEAHYLKDPRGNKRTKAICAPDMLPSVVGRITMASGSIMPNQPIECYNAMRLLGWDSIDRMSLEAFREYYYARGAGFVTGPYLKKTKSGELVRAFGPHWSTDVRNLPRNLDELRYRLRKHVMVRRRKSDVLKELPDRQWHIFPLAPTPGMRKALRNPEWKAVERMYELDPDVFDGAAPIDGAIETARRELGEASAPEVASYVEDLLNSGVQKIIVGAWHHTVMKTLRDRLEKFGLVYMDGNTSSAKKQWAVDQFQENSDVRVILGQMLPLGEGWTLTAAQDLVLAQPYWVPGKNDQLLDRIHRYGQEGDRVIGHCPVVPGSMDERILASWVRKDRSIHQALDGQLH